MSAEKSDEIQQQKELNNDWSATNRYWGDNFVVRVETEGNEAEGEVPHVNATMLTIPDYLKEQTGFRGEHRPDDPDDLELADEWSKTWEVDGSHQESEGVTTTITLSGPTGLLDAEFAGLTEVVGTALPDEWEVVEE